MSKFAAIYFGPEEEVSYRTFLSAMAGLGIIGMTKEQIDATMDTFLIEKAGVMNRITFDDNMEETFRNVMHLWLPKTDFKVTDDPDDEDYAKWLKEKRDGIER